MAKKDKKEPKPKEKKKREVDDKGKCNICKKQIGFTEELIICGCGEFKR